MGIKKKKKKSKKMNYGTAEFYCRQCDYRFEWIGKTFGKSKNVRMAT